MTPGPRQSLGVLVTPPPVSRGQKRGGPSPVRSLVEELSSTARKKPRVSLVELTAPTAVPTSDFSRPVRRRVRPLDHWLNERLVYERKKDSLLPTIVGVVVATLDQEVSHDVLPLPDGGCGVEKTPRPRRRKDAAPLEDLSTSKDAGGLPSSGPIDVDAGDRTEAEPYPETMALVADGEPDQSQVEAENRPSPANVGPPRRRVAGKVRPPTRDQHVDENAYVEQDFGGEWSVMTCAEGSLDSCKMSPGLQSDNWISSDIRVPPRSWSVPERLQKGRAVLLTVLDAAVGSLHVTIDERLHQLNAGDHVLVEEDREYCIKNQSTNVDARLKLVLVLQ